MKVRIAIEVCVILVLTYILVANHSNGNYMFLNSSKDKHQEYYVSKILDYDNLNEMPDLMLNVWVEYLILCFLSQDARNLDPYKHYFTDFGYEKVVNSIENVKTIGVVNATKDSISNSIREVNVGKCLYNSITTIFMCNFILAPPEFNFTGVYLLELHVDNQGKVKNFQIWQY